PYPQPAMPEGVEEGILRGLYKYQSAEKPRSDVTVNLLGSGTILNQVIAAKSILEDQFDIPANVFSVTSYKELYWDALNAERWNLLHPGEERREPYVTQLLGGTGAACVAASDYVTMLPASISKWIPGPVQYIGTEGFGRSEYRETLRDFIEVDARYIVLAALKALAGDGRIKPGVVEKAIKDLNINPDKKNPLKD
ncbi:MAG: pyruvate dehydrogenase (acetyl-transferring), homodimeric type, partial [Candidatus Latescibacterota bacterium]